MNITETTGRVRATVNRAEINEWPSDMIAVCLFDTVEAVTEHGRGEKALITSRAARAMAEALVKAADEIEVSVPGTPPFMDEGKMKEFLRLVQSCPESNGDAATHSGKCATGVMAMLPDREFKCSGCGVVGNWASWRSMNDPSVHRCDSCHDKNIDHYLIPMPEHQNKVPEEAVKHFMEKYAGAVRAIPQNTTSTPETRNVT